jgi:hypothetical protein
MRTTREPSRRCRRGPPAVVERPLCSSQGRQPWLPFGSVLRVRAAGERSPPWRGPPREGPTAAVPRSGAIRVTAVRVAQRLPGAGRREQARQRLLLATPVVSACRLRSTAEGSPINIRGREQGDVAGMRSRSHLRTWTRCQPFRATLRSWCAGMRSARRSCVPRRRTPGSSPMRPV